MADNPETDSVYSASTAGDDMEGSRLSTARSTKPKPVAPETATSFKRLSATLGASSFGAINTFLTGQKLPENEGSYYVVLDRPSGRSLVSSLLKIEYEDDWLYWPRASKQRKDRKDRYTLSFYGWPSLDPDDPTNEQWAEFFDNAPTRAGEYSGVARVYVNMRYPDPDNPDKTILDIVSDKVKAKRFSCAWSWTSYGVTRPELPGWELDDRTKEVLRYFGRPYFQKAKELKITAAVEPDSDAEDAEGEAESSGNDKDHGE